ncbi:MAG: hypothetical protein OXP68_04645 [Anaerolineaceae bacterium]|nr:hypothetical protein [Anaerolineaceae bacterium]MDE0327778.1 hypothetical protein [Anaerolineaceae bacterium]
MSEIQIFHATQDGARELEATPFRNEKELQGLFERHLRDLTGIDFVATEHRTGSRHKRRADTLGLDGKQRPVVIEYKLGHGGATISQGLDYLAWLMDHRGDYRELVRGSLGADRTRNIDFRNARLLCVASEFQREDVENAKTNIRRIGLVSVRRHGESTVFLDWAYGKEANSTNGRERPNEIDFSKFSALDQLVANEALYGYFLRLVEIIRSVDQEVWVEARNGHWVARLRKGTRSNLCYFGAHPQRDYVDINITGKTGPKIFIYKREDLEKVMDPLRRRYVELARRAQP